MQNPLSSEDAAFRFLIGFVLVMVVIVGSVLLVRALT